VAASVRPAPSDRAPEGNWRGTERYEIVRYLGRGGMGVVYEARDRESGQSVALKTLIHATPAALYLFKQEFRTLADVDHPNLVRLYEFVMTKSDRVFFTMELVHGTDFLSYVRGPRARGEPPPGVTEKSGKRLVQGGGSAASDTDRALDPPLHAAAIASVPGLPAARRRARLREARRLIRVVGKKKMPWTAPLVSILEAGVARAEGDRTRCEAALRAAIAGAEAADLALHAAAARHELGLSIAGDEGAALVHDAEEAMAARGVQAPARFAPMLVPGHRGPGTRQMGGVGAVSPEPSGATEP
jgi:hypothetical protein